MNRKTTYRKLKGYKYQTLKDYVAVIPICSDRYINTRFIKLTVGGKLTVKEHYCWDGPSGPTIDTPSFMRGSLVHDALYQLMRERHLDYLVHRKPADELLREMCIDDGMSERRAKQIYDALRAAGLRAAKPPKKNKKRRRGKVYTAP